jgi:hypothetical protein
MADHDLVRNQKDQCARISDSSRKSLRGQNRLPDGE